MPYSRFLRFASAIVMVAALLRGGVATWWQSRLDSQGERFAMGDSDSYWFLAQQLAAGRPYEYHSPDAAVFRAPGYPWLLSWMADPNDPGTGILTARWVGALLGAATVGLLIACVAGFGHRVFPFASQMPTSGQSQIRTLSSPAAWSALLAGCLAAVYPGAIIMSVLVLSEAPFQFLMVASLGCWAAQALSPNRPAAYGWAALAGICSGVAVLVRPSWLLFAPFYYGLRLLVGPDRLRIFSLALCSGLAMAVTLSPWWIRNYRITGHFVPTTLQVGPSLYDGLHPGATGASDTGMQFSANTAARLRAEDARRISEARETGSPPPEFDSLEFRIHQTLAGEAARWALNHPAEALRLAAVKTYRTWWPLPASSQIPGGRLTRWALAIGMLMIAIPAVAWGIRPRIHFPSLWWVWFAPTVYFALLHAIFVGSVRYRQPAMLALCAVAALQYIYLLRIGSVPNRGGKEAPHAQG